MKTLTTDRGTYRVLILAAGSSRRMKKNKMLLPLNGKTIIEQTISRFLEAGQNDITVVAGYKKNQIVPVLKRAGVNIVVNEDFDETDMIESLKIGLKCMPPDTKGVLVTPGDIPFIHPSIIEKVLETGKTGDFLAVIPSYQRKKGHPIFLGRRMISEILNYRGDKGLRGVIEKFESRIAYVEVNDKNMLLDINRLEDYEEAKSITFC